MLYKLQRLIRSRAGYIVDIYSLFVPCPNRLSCHFLPRLSSKVCPAVSRRPLLNPRFRVPLWGGVLLWGVWAHILHLRGKHVEGKLTL